MEFNEVLGMGRTKTVTIRGETYVIDQDEVDDIVERLLSAGDDWAATIAEVFVPCGIVTETGAVEPETGLTPDVEEDPTR